MNFHFIHISTFPVLFTGSVSTLRQGRSPLVCWTFWVTWPSLGWSLRRLSRVAFSLPHTCSMVAFLRTQPLMRTRPLLMRESTFEDAFLVRRKRLIRGRKSKNIREKLNKRKNEKYQVKENWLQPDTSECTGMIHESFNFLHYLLVISSSVSIIRTNDANELRLQHCSVINCYLYLIFQ